MAQLQHQGYPLPVRTVLRQLLTLVLCLSLLPGWGELLENAEHLLHDGHLAHLVDHHDDEDRATHEALEAEHGCTPVSHTCPCHTSIPAVLPGDVDLPHTRVLAADSMRVPDFVERPRHRDSAPPVPPPRA